VVAKYTADNRVRIKSHGFLGRIMDPNIHLYENMTGEIIESTQVVAFVGQPGADLIQSGRQVAIYHYTVKITRTNHS
jgi:hypothetical protein